MVLEVNQIKKLKPQPASGSVKKSMTRLTTRKFEPNVLSSDEFAGTVHQ